MPVSPFRDKVKVDRVACPWLIKKFVDPEAEFLFVPANQVVEKAAMSITSTVAVLQKLKEDGFLRADFPLARYLTGSQ